MRNQNTICDVVSNQVHDSSLLSTYLFILINYFNISLCCLYKSEKSSAFHDVSVFLYYYESDEREREREKERERMKDNRYRYNTWW